LAGFRTQKQFVKPVGEDGAKPVDERNLRKQTRAGTGRRISATRSALAIYFSFRESGHGAGLAKEFPASRLADGKIDNYDIEKAMPCGFLKMWVWFGRPGGRLE